MSTGRVTILILGGGVMQLPAIRIAREKGWRVVLADGNPAPPGLSLADEFLHVDLADREGMAEAAARLKQSGGLDGVFTAGTDFSTTVAWVAERVGLPGIAYETALKATDKARMREAFLAHGVPSPRYLVADGARASAGLSRLPELSDLGLPVVVKPVDNMGARGTRRIDDPSALAEAIATAVGFSRSHRAIVEEYLDGPEFSVDAIVEDGRITVCGIADRHIAFPPHFIEMGHTMPTEAGSAAVAAIVAAFEKGVRALGITHGAAKGDVKLTARGPAIGEIAARLSGGYMSGWTFPYSSGVMPTEAALNLAVGLPAGDLTPRWSMTSAERAFISIPGRVRRVAGFEAACKLPGIKEGFLRVRSGDAVIFPRNNVEKCGNFISQAETREAAASAAEKACQSVLVLLEPGDPDTARFLLGDEHSWPENAFQVDGETMRLLSEMPPFDVRTEDREPALGGPIGIIPFERLATLEVRDWHGETLSVAVERACRCSGARLGGSGPVRLGSVFWQALVRGGAQGGIWAVDTVQHHLRQGGSLAALLAAWRAGASRRGRPHDSPNT